MKLQYLKKKSVVNMYNGNFIGYIKDVEIDLPSGNIKSIMVRLPLNKRIINFLFGSSRFVINWNNIVSIGKDVILVNIIDK